MQDEEASCRRMPTDFGSAWRRNVTALAGGNFAECATAERDEADELADEFADEFECVADAAWADSSVVRMRIGFGSGAAGKSWMPCI